MDVHDRNLLALLWRCPVVGEYRRFLSLHSVPTHCSCCSDIPGDGRDLSDWRMGGKHSSLEAASPKARFATDASCCTDFCQPAYRVSQDRLLLVRGAGRVGTARTASLQDLFNFFDQLIGCKWRRK